MKSFWSRAALVLTVGAALTVASPAHAGLVVTFQESGPDVVATLSGSFAALPTPFNTNDAILRNRVNSGSPYFDSTDQGSGATVNMNDYDFVPVNSFPDFGTATSTTLATTSAGLNTSTLINQGQVSLPTSYVVGTSFTGSLTWAASSFASLGLTPGSYSAAIRNGQTVTINVVPEPSISVMTLVGLACGGYSMFRRRNRA